MDYGIKAKAKTINKISGVYNLANTIIKAAGFNGINSGGYRPSQWAKGNISGGLIRIKSHIGGFFADAVLDYDVTRSLNITNHPVQSGANISDHAILQPRTISCQLGISDSMATYVREGYTDQTLMEELKQALKVEAGNTEKPAFLKNIFTQKSTTSNERKSKAALDLLIKLQALRMPMTIVTPLGFTINNVLIEDMNWNEGSDSQYSIKINLTLKEVFVATVGETKVGARPWTTAPTANGGEKQVQPVEQESTIAKGIGDGGYYNPNKGGIAP